MVVSREKLYTVEDLWEISHLPGNDNKRFELDEGVLIEMSPAGGKHGGIANTFSSFIWNFVRQYKLGYVTAAETGYILFRNPNGNDIVRAPDVGYVRADRLPDGLPDEYIPLAPDLAVEVMSPNDKAEEIQAKVNQYLKYGTRLVWVAYPASQTVVIHTVSGSFTVDENGTLDGGDVLPDFKLLVREIFPTK